MPPESLFVAAWRPRYLLMMRCVPPWAQTLSALGLLALLAACGMSHGARAALDAGLKAREQARCPPRGPGALPQRNGSLPDSAPAQVALGEVAEVLGEFDEALVAYQAAARRTPSTTTWLRLGEIADRMKHVDLAILSLEGAYGPWREHACWRLLTGARDESGGRRRSR